LRDESLFFFFKKEKQKFMNTITLNIKTASNNPMHQQIQAPIRPPQSVIPTYTPRLAPIEVRKPVETHVSVEPKKFSLDFTKSGIIKDDNIYQNNFRYKTEQNLKGTLKSAVDRQVVADLLWSKRGSGITKDEVKFGLRKLEASGKLRSDQVKAVRRKFGVY